VPAAGIGHEKEYPFFHLAFSISKG
jgi:hypothetical protein